MFALIIISIFLIFHFLNLSNYAFIPGAAVDQEEFKEAFDSSDLVYIVMDVRSVEDNETSRNILQCGVDFAGSSGMGGKSVNYFSISEEEGCIAPDGSHEESYCFSQLKNGITLYVREGGETTFHSNGMVVGIGPEYALGTCGIHRVV